MSFKAELRIDDRRINVLYADYDFIQHVNKEGMIIKYPQSGFIRVIMESQADNMILEWALSSTQKKSGSLYFFKRDNMTRMKELIFTDAYCVEFKEKFSSTGNNSMIIEAKLSAGELRFGTSSYKNPWFENAGMAVDDNYIKEYAPKSVVKKEEPKESAQIVASRVTIKPLVDDEDFKFPTGEPSPITTNTFFKDFLPSVNDKNPLKHGDIFTGNDGKIHTYIGENKEVTVELEKTLKKESNFEKYQKKVFNHEGGFVDHPDDKGGATNKGITMNTFKAFAKQDLDLEPTLENLKNLSNEQASVIYKKRYWDTIKADEIKNPSVAYSLYDFNVNAGNNSIKVLQKSLNELGQDVVVDGKIGSKTIAAINNEDPQKLFNVLKENRKKYYKKIIEKNPKQKVFEKGWMNRVNSLIFEK